MSMMKNRKGGSKTVVTAPYLLRNLAAWGFCNRHSYYRRIVLGEVRDEMRGHPYLRFEVPRTCTAIGEHRGILGCHLVLSSLCFTSFAGFITVSLLPLLSSWLLFISIIAATDGNDGRAAAEGIFPPIAECPERSHGMGIAQR